MDDTSQYEKMVMKWLLTGIAVFATFILAYLSVIFVPEGHVGRNHTSRESGSPT